MGLVNEQGEIRARKTVPTVASRQEDEIIAAMAGAAQDMLAQAGVSPSQIASVGIGSPGAVDSAAGVVVSACNLRFRNTPLAEKMRRYFSCPVYVENDANCAAWAEATAGAAKGTRDSVMITLGTGVGGGIVIGGRLYGGFNNYGGEFGHTVICADGELCACGRRGCLEAYASATALIRDAKRAAEQHRESLLWTYAAKEGAFSGKTVFAAAEQGDATAREVLDRYVYYLSLGLINLIRIFQPEVLVVGGGIAQAGDALLSPLTERVGSIYGSYVTPEKRTKIKAASLGNDAGIVGAALLGKEIQV